MLQTQFISVTQLQRQTKKCLQDIDKVKRKFILSNNKPKAVILSIEEYNRLIKSEIPEVEPYPDEIEAIKKYEEEKKKNGFKNFIEVDEEFFKSLGV